MTWLSGPKGNLIRARPLRSLVVAVIAGAIGAMLLTGCTGVRDGHPLGGAASLVAATVSRTSAATSAPASPTPSATPTPSTTPTPSATPTPTPTGAPVHIKLLDLTGDTDGVAMPMIAYFSAKITDAAAFTKATTVTVNGIPAQGAWYFEASAQMSGYPVEAHYRLQNYWPAHAAIALTMATQGVSAGTGLVFDDSLTMAWNTGRADVLSVDGLTHQLTVMSDNALYGTFPVSLGAAKTPTLLGTKVVMEKDRNERMIGPGYNEIVPWSLRLTNSGEFLHAAPWNVANIGVRSTSNGCTNLLPKDAEQLFNYLQIGDPVTYVNVTGATQPSWDGYGDWNVSWSAWQAGGSVPTTA